MRVFEDDLEELRAVARPAGEPASLESVYIYVYVYIYIYIYVNK